MLKNGLDEKGIFEWDGRGRGASGTNLEEAGAGRRRPVHRAWGRELGAAGEGARGEPCGKPKSRQVPAAQRKVVDFILSRVEAREGLSGRSRTRLAAVWSRERRGEVLVFEFWALPCRWAEEAGS